MGTSRSKLKQMQGQGDSASSTRERWSGAKQDISRVVARLIRRLRPGRGIAEICEFLILTGKILLRFTIEFLTG
jgi:hypothetical protein